MVCLCLAWSSIWKLAGWHDLSHCTSKFWILGSSTSSKNQLKRRASCLDFHSNLELSKLEHWINRTSRQNMYQLELTSIFESPQLCLNYLPLLGFVPQRSAEKRQELPAALDQLPTARIEARDVLSGGRGRRHQPPSQVGQQVIINPHTTSSPTI